MSQPIAVNYGAMEQAAGVIRNSSQTIESELSELGSRLDRIAWEGQDREAYLAQRQKWEQAIADMNMLLNQIGGAVETARQGYGDVERAGVNAWG
jgi:WXG100 family type VII secretion target